MDLCNFCGNILAYGENHICSFHTIDSTYSHAQLFSENTFNSRQEGIPYTLPSFDIFSHIRVSYPKTKVNPSATGTSENIESGYRPENDFREAFNISPIVKESTGVGEDFQRGSGIPEMIHAARREGYEMSRQENRWLSWNNDIINCMDPPKCVIRTDHSDNSNISALRNMVLNIDVLPRRNVQENDQTHVSQYVSDRHTSHEMHFNLYRESEKTTTCATEHISSQTDSSAVAGSSGMCPRKKKFPCPFCLKVFNRKDTFGNHYRTHTREKTFVCKVCEKVFTRKDHLKRHIRTHTGETPFVCKVCEKAFSQKSILNRHMKTHTDEKPFICKVCEKAFRCKRNLQTHMRTHDGEKNYKCPVCGLTFTYSSTCNRHQNEMHK